MKTLFAIVYDSQDSAERGQKTLFDLQKGATISLVDSVIVTRSPDGGIKLHQLVNTTAAGALSGAFWGSLVGLIFLAPALGALVGAATGALGGYATDYGIDDGFIRETSEKLAPGKSALFVLAADMTTEKVGEALGKAGGEILYSSMPEDVEQRFKAQFSQKSVAAEPEIQAAAAALDN